MNTPSFDAREGVPTAAGLTVLELANADLIDSCQWVPTAVEPGTTPLPIYPQKEHSLARANGCDSPACARGAHDPKTPAAGDKGCRVAAAGRNTGDDTARKTLQRPVGGGAR